MRRVTLALQVALAATLVTATVLLWPPRSTECDEDGSACDESVFREVVREPASPLDADDVVPATMPFSVEYGGCTLVVAAGPDEVECIYDPEVDLRLWVTHSRLDELRVEVDGKPWAATPYREREEPGQGLRAKIPGDAARRLVVRAPDEEPWELRVRAKARLTAAEQATVRRLDEEALRLQGFLYQGDLGKVPAVEAMIDRLLAQGMLSLAVDEALAATNHLVWQAHRVDLAQERMLERVRSAAARYPEGKAAFAIYEADVLEQQGRLVEAAMAYREGGRHALRTDDAALQLDALSDYALVLAELGYFEAALYWGKRVLDIARKHGRPADQVAVKIMVARVGLKLRQAGQDYDDPRPPLQEVLQPPPSTAEPDDPGETEPARLALARLEQLDGRLGDALGMVDALDRARLTPEQRVEAQDVRLQVLLATEASPEELQDALDELEASASAPISPGAPWLVALRRGEVHEQAGDLDAAQAAYEESERVLDRLIPLALLGAQGELAPARRREGTERLVSLLLTRGRPDQAFCVLRQSQARVGRLARLFTRLGDDERARLRPRVAEYLQAKREYEALLRSTTAGVIPARDQAKRDAEQRRHELDRLALEILATPADHEARPTCDTLSPRLPGELLVGLYPHRDGVLVLVQDDDGTTHRELARLTTLTRADNVRWLGDVLLDPLDARLARATRVRVLASGEAAAIDLHGLPWRGRPLVEQVPVVYGLDLPPLTARRRDVGDPSALVLADVRAKGSRLETETTWSLLHEAGWAAKHRRSTELTTVGLRQELAGVDHFHYAGHAEFRDDPELRRLWPPYPGGAAAEPASIPLGTDERLDVQDILMMEEVPRTVVLMGCETGVHDDRVAHGGFSLATAFLAAGAEAVVASTREIDGAEASLVGRGLHVELGGGAANEPGAWVMRAMRWARERGLEERAVRDYRVLVP